jgi:hypothetical protein
MAESEMVKVTVAYDGSGSTSQTKPVLAAILDVHQPEGQDLCEVALVLFTYDRQHSEVLQVMDSYVGQTRWILGEIPPAHERPANVIMENATSNSFDTLRVADMLEKPEFLIAHNAEFAQSFVCRLYESTRTKHWKCSKKDIDWARLGLQSSEFDWLLKHHQIEMNSEDVEQNGAFALLCLLRLQSSDGRSYLSHLLKE